MPKWLKTWQVRIIEGIIANLSFAVSVIGFFNIQPTNYSIQISLPVAIFALILSFLTFVTWALTEKSVDNEILVKGLSKADEDLYRNFIAIFDDDLIHFIQHHDFGNEFDRSFTSKISQFNFYWEQPTYQFQNQILNRHLSQVKTDAKTFVLSIATNTIPSNPEQLNSRVIIAHTEQFEFTTQTRNRIKSLNDNSTRLYNSVSELIANYINFAN